MVKLQDLEYQHLLGAEKECLKNRQAIRSLEAELREARAKFTKAEKDNRRFLAALSRIYEGGCRQLAEPAGEDDRNCIQHAVNVAEVALYDIQETTPAAGEGSGDESL